MITEFIDVFPENSLDKLPLMYDTQNTVKSDLEEVLCQIDEKACGNSDNEHDDQINKEAYEGEDIAHNCIRQTPSIHLPAVSTVFSQVGEKNTEKQIAILHTLTKIGNKNCKLNVDCGSCINGILQTDWEGWIKDIIPFPPI